MVRHDSHKIVVDTGPDFRTQMLREKVMDLDSVLYTHEHADHVLGLDDLRPFNFMLNKEIELYAEKRVFNGLKQMFHYAFSNAAFGGLPKVNCHDIPESLAPFRLGEIAITPIRVMHHRLPILGFRFNDFCYITDANFIADEEKEKIKGAKVLVINALQKTPHISHYTLDQALELIDELGVPQNYLTHISHKMGTYASIAPELPDHVQFAYDGLKLHL